MADPASAQRKVQVRETIGPTLPEERIIGSRPDGDIVDLLPYAELLQKWWRTIGAMVAVAVLITALYTTFVEMRTYQAIAILKPLSASDMQSALAGSANPFGMAGTMMSLFGVATDDAQEYIAILTSFSFTDTLVSRHNLRGELLRESEGLFGGDLKPKDPRWFFYRIMKGRFSAESSIKTGLLTLTYEDPSRAHAEQILGYYIDDLRDKLRQRKIHDASAAVASLRGEAAVTNDDLLRTQLYELMAKQIQQQRLAQVQADFAFQMIEPPVARDSPYRPKRTLDCIIAAFVALIVTYLGIMLYEGWTRTSSECRLRPREIS